MTFDEYVDAVVGSLVAPFVEDCLPGIYYTACIDGEWGDCDCSVWIDVYEHPSEISGGQDDGAATYFGMDVDIKAILKGLDSSRYLPRGCGAYMRPGKGAGVEVSGIFDGILVVINIHLSPYSGNEVTPAQVDPRKGSVR